ncbi:hypothetical protein SEA_SQUIDDLY_100 [Gordonia phage Squiddly]|nr:hypothetical protein SEA_SQUIDDLY_100 [Gordonia phage Squiddly]
MYWSDTPANKHVTREAATAGIVGLTGDVSPKPESSPPSTSCALAGFFVPHTSRYPGWCGA